MEQGKWPDSYFLTKDILFEVWTAAIMNSAKENLWLIGGAVYRNLIEHYYGTPSTCCDYDFLFERLRKPLAVPPGWNGRSNSFGGLKLVKGSISMDFIDEHSHRFIRNKGLAFNIGNVLGCTPFTIHSIAYDIREKKIMGDAGLAAILSKTVRVHNREAAEACCRQYNVSVHDLLREKAESIGFTPIFD